MRTSRRRSVLSLALAGALAVPVGAALRADAATTAGFPTVDRGLEFGPSLVTDPQRSQGESAAFADEDGVLYSCGTNGASNGTDHGSVSVDGGETWRPLGTAPIGETGTIQGGGDCAIGTGQDKNAQGKRQLAFSGLGPLTGFSSFTSPDHGRTLTRSPSQNGVELTDQQSLVDRQWLEFTSDKRVILNYNAALGGIVPGTASGQVVQISEDGGLTFGPQIQASNESGRIGQIRAIREGVVPGVDPTKDVVYFPYSSGNLVKLAISFDAGVTWTQCLAVDAGVSPTAGFVAADHDREGNLYVTYAEKGQGRDTYLVALPASKVKDCKGSAPTADSEKNVVDPGFTRKLRMNREGVETTVMPWVAAGGAPGRVAVAYYGTETVGNPDEGTFKATWDVHVSQVVDMFDGSPSVDQVKATTHPNHYDSICLNGLQCTVDNADRSLVDYFTMDYDPKGDRLVIVYNQAGKRPDDPQGVLAQPVVTVQQAGPAHGGGTLTPARPTLRTAAGGDSTGEAFVRWTTGDSVLGTPAAGLPGPNVPALDLQDVAVAPQTDLAGKPVEDGGFDVTMTLDDLSAGALQSALTTGQATSLVYLFRFFDGYRPAGVAAYYELGRWRFGYSDYVTSRQVQASNTQQYPGSTPLEGKVDAEQGTITISVPRSLLKALSGPTGPGQRPQEVEATEGSRIYDAAAWTFTNQVPLNQVPTYLTQADNTRSFDFLVRSAATAAQPGLDGVGGGQEGSGDTGSLAATGASAVLPALALLLLGATGWAVRRRRA